MKLIVGFMYLLVVTIISVVITLNNKPANFGSATALFLGSFGGIYLGTVVLGACIWGFVWVANMVNVATMWPIEAVLSPLLLLPGLF